MRSCYGVTKAVGDVALVFVVAIVACGSIITISTSTIAVNTAITSDVVFRGIFWSVELFFFLRVFLCNKQLIFYIFK